jgi:hypothetical protein
MLCPRPKIHESKVTIYHMYLLISLFFTCIYYGHGCFTICKGLITPCRCQGSLWGVWVLDTPQRCLLWCDRAKSHRNVKSPSQRRVASLWQIATLLLQWNKLVTINFFYIHLVSNTSDADNGRFNFHILDYHDLQGHMHDQFNASTFISSSI